MTLIPRRRLGFSDVDGLAFAAERGRLDGHPPSMAFEPVEIGPLIEMVQLSKGGLLPPPHGNHWIALDGVAPFYSALAAFRDQWICPRTRQVGLIRTTSELLVDDTPWTAFCLEAQRGAVSVGFPKKIAAQLIGALGEMQSNIYEHSEAANTGLVAFRAAASTFEFVVADRGIGVLGSLRSCIEYTGLVNHGEALTLALKDGCSRFGPGLDRGRGFRPLFVGLANLSRTLRFRSGDHALTISGPNQTLKTAQTAQKPYIDGFLISALCTI